MAVWLALGLPLKGSGRGSSTTPFVSLGQNATIAAETTATARTIAAVRHYDGNVFIGYGDYGANTGPVDLIYWDGAAFQVAHSAFASEATHSLKVASGKLWAVATDPRASEDYLECTGTVCTAQSRASLTPIHLFDLYGHTDGTLFAVGSSNPGADDDPTVWRSTDAGVTWSIVDRPSVATVPARYHTIFYENGAFWTQVAIVTNARTSADGITWSDAGFRISAAGSFVTRAVKFDGDTAILEADWLTAGNILRFDGTGVADYHLVTDRSGVVYDICVADGYLYALTGHATYGSELWRKSTWAGTWAEVANLATNILRSIDVHDGTAWAGGTDSRLYQITGLGTLNSEIILVDDRGSQLVDASGSFLVAA